MCQSTLPDIDPMSPLLDVRPIYDRSTSLFAFAVLFFFTILHCLLANHWSHDTDLCWHTCRHISLSLTHLVQFIVSVFLTTCCGVSVAAASACINATMTVMLRIILVSVPNKVCLPRRGTHCAAHTRGPELAGGSDEESHQT